MAHNRGVALAYGSHPVCGEYVNREPTAVLFFLKLQSFQYHLHNFCPK